MSLEFSVACNLGQRSGRVCGPAYANLQTFGELDAAAGGGNGGSGRQQVKRLSWMLLSRVGINYLMPPSTYASWTVCQHHKKEFLDNWQVDNTCCYPDHEEDFTDESKPTELISLVMAIKLLQSTGKVTFKMLSVQRNFIDGVSFYSLIGDSNQWQSLQALRPPVRG